MEKHSNTNSTEDNNTDSMQQRVAALEKELERQRKIAFAAGLFQNDVTVRTLLESLAEGVIITDKSGAIVLANKRAEEVFGYQKNELIGHPVTALLPERYRHHHENLFDSFFSSPLVRSMGEGRDLVGLHKDGTEFPVEISLSYLDTELGRLGLAFITDISLRKQVEWALKRRNEELDAFAHTVAHDLQSSLAVMLGYTETLTQTTSSLSREEVDESVQALDRTARRMSNIIEELLVFASVRKEDITIQPLNMKRIVDNALQRLQYLINETHAQIFLPEQYEFALGHAPWVEEIWLNYISNSLKYGGNPPVIRLGSTTQGETIEFWIQDNGPGLSEEVAGTVFNSYSNGDIPRIQGHGLGLSIVKQIVEKLDGQVRVTGTPGQGSRFSFTLPAARIAD